MPTWIPAALLGVSVIVLLIAVVIQGFSYRRIRTLRFDGKTTIKRTRWRP